MNDFGTGEVYAHQEFDAVAEHHVIEVSAQLDGPDPLVSILMGDTELDFRGVRDLEIFASLLVATMEQLGGQLRPTLVRNHRSYFGNIMGDVS